MSQPTPNEVEVRRSARRRRTVSAYRDGERIVVLIPARFTRSEERRWVDEMVERVTSRELRERSRGPRRSDAALARRCRELSARYPRRTGHTDQRPLGRHHANPVGLLHAERRHDPGVDPPA